MHRDPSSELTSALLADADSAWDAAVAEAAQDSRRPRLSVADAAAAVPTRGRAHHSAVMIMNGHHADAEPLPTPTTPTTPLTPPHPWFRDWECCGVWLDVLAAAGYVAADFTRAYVTDFDEMLGVYVFIALGWLSLVSAAAYARSWAPTWDGPWCPHLSAEACNVMGAGAFAATALCYSYEGASGLGLGV